MFANTGARLRRKKRKDLKMRNIQKAAAAALIILLGIMGGCSKSSSAFSPSEESQSPVLMYINGFEVRSDELRYWISSYAASAGYEVGPGTDWNADAGGMPLSEYTLTEAVKAVSLYKTVESKSAELGIALTEDELSEISSDRAKYVDYFKGEEAYLAYLESVFLTEELNNSMMKTSALYSKLIESVYGTDGSKCTDEEAVAFGTENNYFRAKHILLSNKLDDGTPLSDEEKAELYARMEQMLIELDSSDDPVTLFDELMHENSEDPGLATNPDGYQFVKGEVMPEFQAAVESLDNYSYSGIVEMDAYGYSIIMRLPLDPDAVSMSDNYGYSLRYTAAMSNFDNMLTSWTDEAEIKYTDMWDGLDIAKLFADAA